MPINRTGAFVIAAAFGCVWWLALLVLAPYVSLLASPMVKMVRSIGVTELATFSLISRTFWIIVYALMSGLIFGLPLGMLARAQWVRVSVAFIVAAISTGLGFSLAGELGLSEYLSARNLPGQTGLAWFVWAWGRPEPWIILLSVAVFVWLGYRLRSRFSYEGSVAP